MSVKSSAYNYLGTPYVWGGTSSNGVDCSGLTQNVYKENGVNIPRTSQEQYAYTSNNRITNKADLKEGDLVFFKGYTNSATNPGHVGIYIGNGQYIHAPKSGDVVKVGNLSDRKDFVGGGRVTGTTSSSSSTSSTKTTTGTTSSKGSSITTNTNSHSSSSGSVHGGGGGSFAATNVSEDNSELSFLGKIIQFLILIGIAVVGVVFFTKAFGISTSPKDMVSDIVNDTIGKYVNTPSQGEESEKE